MTHSENYAFPLTDRHLMIAIAVVWQLDKLQYSLDEGPCVESLRQAS